MRRKRSPKTGVFPKNTVDFSKLYSDFISSLRENTGSAATFLGVARRESARKGRSVKALVMESYELHANKVLGKICIEVKKKYALNDIVIVHALGSFKPGEPVVFVAVSSPRRERSFHALHEAVERYKKEPALFKKEVYLDGTSSWIH